MRLLFAVLAMAILVSPQVAASGELAEGPLTVQVQDNHPYYCAQEVAGFCEVTIGGDSFQNTTVNAYARVSAVDVTLDNSTARHVPGVRWLPGESVAINGTQGYLPNPILPFLVTNWNALGLRPYLSPVIDINMRQNNTMLTYTSVNMSDPSHPSLDPEHQWGWGYEDNPNATGVGIQYDRIGPFTSPGEGEEHSNSDGYINSLGGPVCGYDPLGDCRQRFNTTTRVIEDETPNATAGFEFYNVDVTIANASNNGWISGWRMVNGTWMRDGWQATPVLGRPDSSPTVTHSESVNHPPADTVVGRAGLDPQRAASYPLSVAAIAHPSGLLQTVAVAAASVILLVAGVILYSRITSKKRALESEARRRLLQIVSETSGLSLAEAAEMTGLARGTIEYHLKVLVRFKLLRVVRDNGQVLIYTAEATPGAAEIQRSDAAARIIYELQQSGSLLRSELHSRLSDFPLRTRNHQIRKLIDRGIVAVTGSGADQRISLRIYP